MTTAANAIPSKACDQCGNAFNPKTDRARYCSDKCQQRARYSRNPYNKGTFGSGTTANRGRAQSDEHVKRRSESLAATLAATRRQCVKCNGEFTPSTAAQKYCSGMCWNSVARLRRPKKDKVSIHSEHYAELYERQNGKCAICRSENGSNGRGDRLAVDHCHTTGHIRGLLCHKCNTAIGLLQDSEQNILSALAYLREARFRI